ncbi:MAG TPA: hypothetical protein VKV40_10320 [Ktedonobacteraceae bacterium]|nr:hypothetical protein [Ktedonobacteraceae bacterium]
MTTSPQTAIPPMTISFSERLSETWLLERTYHAQLRNGQELSVSNLTCAMKQLTDFDVPLSSQSAKSKLAERLPLKKSANFSVPVSTWREISQEEASATSQQGISVLLYAEHAWGHVKGAEGAWKWSPNKNMRFIISGNAGLQPEAVSGTDYAVCYIDPQRGTFSNAVWKAWFASDPATMLEGDDHSTITFFGPCVQFPYTTHYTVIAADGQVYEYADRAGAVQGFQTLPSREVSSGSQVQTVFPQFCYYHEVTCPSGVCRIEFFGLRMDERGYPVKEAA